MKDYIVKRYNPEDSNAWNAWNAFVREAKNATFLFDRDFMDYHADRFSDFSLMIYEDRKLVSLLPANRIGNTVYSHQGLTYGGLVLPENIKLVQVLDIFKSLLSYLQSEGIITLQLKPIPPIYCQFFSEEIDYCLFLTKAKLFRRDCLSVLDLAHPLSIPKGRAEGIKRGIKSHLTIRKENDFSAFWNEILIPNYWRRHKVKPVHNLEEITLLHQRFPENIALYTVYEQDRIVGGTTVFISKQVVHAQYISGNEDKNEIGSIDFLHHHLITEVFKDYKYYDFGISNEHDGKHLNSGMLYWKASFGARTVVQDFYEVSTANHPLLDGVLL